MPRTTIELVKALIETEEDFDLTPFVETASSIVDVLVSKANPALTDKKLELIERWLSAHCYATYDPRPTDEKAGPVSATYESNTDLFLSNSKYGQMAINLDTSGYLRSLNKGRVAGKVTWLGTC